MSVLRRLAIKVSDAASRHCPCDSKSWANAARRELDFIEADRQALWWALGGVTAISKHCALQVQRRIFSTNKEERTMKETAKNVSWMLLGVTMAAMLAIAAYGLMRLLFYFFPRLELQQVPWPAWLTVIALPEIAFVFGTIKLWKKRRPMALGILVSAVILGTHFAMHIASHWQG